MRKLMVGKDVEGKDKMDRVARNRLVRRELLDKNSQESRTEWKKGIAFQLKQGLIPLSGENIFVVSNVRYVCMDNLTGRIFEINDRTELPINSEIIETKVEEERLIYRDSETNQQNEVMAAWGSVASLKGRQEVRQPKMDKKVIGKETGYERARLIKPESFHLIRGIDNSGDVPKLNGGGVGLFVNLENEVVSIPNTHALKAVLNLDEGGTRHQFAPQVRSVGSIIEPKRRTQE